MFGIQKQLNIFLHLQSQSQIHQQSKYQIQMELYSSKTKLIAIICVVVAVLLIATVVTVILIIKKKNLNKKDDASQRLLIILQLLIAIVKIRISTFGCN